MADGSTATVLRRKAERARAGAAEARGPIGPARALSDALRRAAEAELQLTVAAGEPRQRRATPAELLEDLPEQAFLGVLIGPEDGAGLFCLDADALSAVIEMRTMGRVSARPAQPRRATRTDAAMVSDLIDKVLAEFEAPLLGSDDARWASGWRYQLYLPEPRPLPVVLEEAMHRVWEIEVLFGAAARPGKVLIALPATGRALPQSPEPPAAGSAEARATAAWRHEMNEVVETAEVMLDTVLGRIRLSLSELARLAPGDRIAFPTSALGVVQVLAAGGQAMARGRLGQAGGARAVMLCGATDGGVPGPATEGTVIVAGSLNNPTPDGRMPGPGAILSEQDNAPVGRDARGDGPTKPGAGMLPDTGGLPGTGGFRGFGAGGPAGDLPARGGGPAGGPAALARNLPERGSGDPPHHSASADPLPGAGRAGAASPARDRAAEQPLGAGLPDLGFPDAGPDGT